jgi:hypothetical protein
MSLELWLNYLLSINAKFEFLLLNSKCSINEKDEDGVTALILGIFHIFIFKS